MVVQTPPFLKAVASDPLYRMLIENKEESFWRAHLKNKPNTFHFSESFKLLVTGLLQYDSAARFSMSDVLASRWMQDQTVPK